MVRNYGLDLARISAAYLVMFGHLTFAATVSLGRPFSDWAGANESLPLLTKEGNWLWQINNYLLSDYGTATAIVGVSLFFLISGWLMPPMLDKYGRSIFLVNRFFRIFPMLIFAVFCSAAIQYYLGDRKTFDMAGVLATATLTTDIFGRDMTLGVVWTLIIEFEFYLLLALLGTVTQKKILATSAIIMIISISSLLFGIKPKVVLADLYFIVYMLIGSSARLAFERSKFEGTGLYLACPVLVIAAFEINRYVTVHLLGVNPGQEINVISQIATALLFLAFAMAGKVITKTTTTVFLVEKSSDLTYSIYLMHMAIGSYFISKFRHISANEYTTVLCTFVVVTAIAAVTYQLIEKPGIQLFKTLSRRRNSIDATSAV